MGKAKTIDAKKLGVATAFSIQKKVENFDFFFFVYIFETQRLPKVFFASIVFFLV